MKKKETPTCPQCGGKNTVYAMKTFQGCRIYGCLDCRATAPELPIERFEFTEEVK